MPQQQIGVGNAPNDRRGDPARAAFVKVNANFAELYQLVTDLGIDMGAIPAADVVESTARVFVTPAQRTEIGALRADFTTLVGGVGSAYDTLPELLALINTKFNASGVSSFSAEALALLNAAEWRTKLGVSPTGGATIGFALCAAAML